MWARRWRFCKDCNAPMFDRFPPLKDVWCLECRIKRARESAIQLSNKSGPYYDRWLATRGPQGRPPNH